MNNYYQQPYNPYGYPYGGVNGAIWVPGESGAKSHPMAPGTSAVLLDSEIEGRMYIKIADPAGICTLRYFDYNEIFPNSKNAERMPDMEQFVTKDEFNKAIDEIKEAMNGKQTVSTTRRSETSK